jgi:ribonuclease HIII
MLDNEALFAYWQHGCEQDRANQIVQEALREPPASAKTVARALQIAHRLSLAESWRQRVDAELGSRLERLKSRLEQVDVIGELNNDPEILFEALGDEAETLDLDVFDVQRLRAVRLGVHRAQAAQNLLEELGSGALPKPLRAELLTAIADLGGQINRGELAQALLVGFGGEGFVVGLHLGLSENEAISTEEQVTNDLDVAAKTALREVLGTRGARYGMEWSLPFEGPSIGLPMALAALVATGKLQPDPLLAATGKVEAGGTVTGIGGIEAKLAAAAAAGLRRVVLPAENEAEALALKPGGLDLRFVEHIDQLRRAASVRTSSIEVGVAAKKRIVRTLARPLAGFELIDEKPIAHGYQFKLGSLLGKGSLTLYDSGSVVVGAGPAVKPPLDDFADRHLREPEPQTRSPLVLQLPSPQQEAVRQALLSAVADEVEVKPHERWRLRLSRGKSAATAVLYTSGKLVVQGTAPAHDEVRDALVPLLSGLAGSDALVATPPAQRVQERREQSANESWIGTDESGKGDYFGPLVSAGVYVDRELADRLERLGVRDSKKLSDKRVLALAPQLRNILGPRARTTIIGPPRYNELYREFRAEGKNLNSLLAWGHYRSVLDLLKAGATPGYLIVDQFADARYIEERLASETQRRDVEILQFPKAEADVAVAAASILAREAFLAWLAKTSHELGVTLPKGASQQVIEVARQIVATHGEAALGGYAKLSFKTTEKVLAA